MSKKVTFVSCVNYAKRNGIQFAISGQNNTSNVWLYMVDAYDGYGSSQCWCIHYDYMNRSYNSRYSDVVMLDYRGYAFVKDETLLDMVCKALDNDRHNVMMHVSYFDELKWYGACKHD